MKHTVRRSLVASSLVFATALGAGCAAPVDPDSAEAVDSTSQAIIDKEYVSNGGTIDLWYSSLAFCYLTGVTGNLDMQSPDVRVAGPEEVKLYVGADDRWHLQTSPAVTATARCSLWSDFRPVGAGRKVSTYEGWTFGLELTERHPGAHVESPADWRRLWSGTSLCYLSGALAGTLHGFDSAMAEVAVDRDASGWYGRVSGTGRSVGGFWGIGSWWESQAPYGRAMCIDTGRSFKLEPAPGGATTFRWRQGEPSNWMMPISKGICMLTGMKGHFAGYGEAVRIHQENQHWKLDGASMQQGVSASAQCIPYNQLQISGGFDVGGIKPL